MNKEDREDELSDRLYQEYKEEMSWRYNQWFLTIEDITKYPNSKYYIAKIHNSETSNSSLVVITDYSGAINYPIGMSTHARFSLETFVLSNSHRVKEHTEEDD